MLLNISPFMYVGSNDSCKASLLAGFSVQREAAPVDPKQVYKFYMHLGKLFILSYFVLPMAR
jgi:hypothetical protein